MALDDNAVVLPGRGYLFVNDNVGAPAPFTAATVGAADLNAATVGDGWRNFGHTADEDAVKLTRTVEEGKVKGTWQKPNLRETPDKVQWGFAIPSVQIDNDTLEMYFQGGDTSDPDVFHVTKTSSAVEVGFVLVLVDGPFRLPIYVPKVSVKGDGDIELDKEEFVQLPLKATVLDDSASEYLMDLHKIGLGTPAAP